MSLMSPGTETITYFVEFADCHISLGILQLLAFSLLNLVKGWQLCLNTHTHIFWGERGVKHISLPTTGKGKHK